jgi:pullulanase
MRSPRSPNSKPKVPNKMEKKLFYCYLDDFDELTIIVPMKFYRDNNVYTLAGNEETITLTVIEKQNLGLEVKLICAFDAYIRPEKTYRVIDEDGISSELLSGKIVRTELFDNIYYYKKNDLGFTYTKESTKFKIWTPTAKKVTLELIDKTGKETVHDVPYNNLGVWRLVVEGDLEGYKYRYRIHVNGLERIVCDPYAIASTANAEYSFVIDRAKLVPMEAKTDFSGNPLDAIIYETSIRDFTIDPDMPFVHKGKYLGMTETGIRTPAGNKAGLDYLRELGITHVQLMPFFDFAGIDEKHPGTGYNWGYNPRQYLVPDGWFASDPDDPYARINETRRMIEAFHQNNINVVMDVVYNHVWDATEFSFEKIVPGYAYHVDKQGIYTNASGCKNDLATHRKMIRKLIIDSVLYWASEYKVDGFRFDLMGLIDVETMNELRQELHELDGHIIVYGEGWKMYATNLADRMAHMGNKNVIYTIGFFNDRFRETIKGKTFDLAAKGYATGNRGETAIVKEVLLGSALNRFMFKYASQSINYVECHDNHTFFDKALKLSPDIALVKKQQKLATSMVLLAQGVPFLHSGQEFCRTKQGVENSYVSSDAINLVDWSRLDDNLADVRFLSKLIALRKAEGCFKLQASSDLAQSAEVLVLDSGSILYSLTDGTDFIIVFKPAAKPETIVIPEGYQLLLASTEAFLPIASDEYELQDIGTYVFQKQRMI